jgi:hypothetical protein
MDSVLNCLWLGVVLFTLVKVAPRVPWMLVIPSLTILLGYCFRDPINGSTHTMHAPCKHHANTMHAPCKHHANTMQTPCKHHANLRWELPTLKSEFGALPADIVAFPKVLIDLTEPTNPTNCFAFTKSLINLMSLITLPVLPAPPAL